MVPGPVAYELKCVLEQDTEPNFAPSAASSVYEYA